MTETMQAVVVEEAGAPWRLRERPRPEPGPGEVLVRVHACAICGTDGWLSEGVLSFRPFPLVLGHEGVGEVVALGPGVVDRLPGDRVGMPMMQRGCGRCRFCRQERPESFVTASSCESPVLTGVTVDGAHAEYVAVAAAGTVLLPDGLSFEAAAPTLCAGYTVWAGLRRAAPAPGARVAVVGLGGLGHFAVQFAAWAGHHVTVVTSTPGKAEQARALGAHEVVEDGAGLARAGGADLLLHTSSSHTAAVDAMGGLRPWGTVVVNGISTEDMPVPALPLVSSSHRILGSAHNGMEYLAEALEVVASGAVSPVVEVFDKADVGRAYARSASRDLRFKAVVTY